MRFDRRFRIILIALLIGLISVFHYSTKLSYHHLHIVHLALYYIPILLAGFWFGLRGSLAACAGVTVAVSPFIVINWDGFSPDNFVSIMEISHYFMVALVLGILRNRELSQQRSLRFAERLAATGKAMSGVAHDMRTPLMAIGGFTGQLLAKAGKVEQDPERSPAFIRESKQKLSIVMKEAGRLENLVKDMLDFARPLELNRTMEDIHQLVNDCLPIVGGVADERRVAVSNQCPVDLPLVSLDAVRMKQVLINILTDAIHASPGGETVVTRGASREEESFST